MVSTLRLVFPPVSNFEAETIKEDPAVEAMLRTSDFYVIAARAEVLIDVVRVREDAYSVRLMLSGQSHSGEGLFDMVDLDIEQLATDTIGGLPDE